MPRDRKSLDEHKLTGTKPQYVVPTSDVKPGRPRYPKSLTPEARRFFKGICSLLEKRRTLTEGDAELIRLAAILRGRHERAIRKLEVEGEVCTYTRLDSNSKPVEVEKPNLWLGVAKDAEKQLVAVLDRLGLTPANRSKIKQTVDPAAQTSPEDERLLSREAAAATPDEDLDKLLKEAESIQ